MEIQLRPGVFQKAPPAGAFCLASRQSMSRANSKGQLEVKCPKPLHFGGRLLRRVACLALEHLRRLQDDHTIRSPHELSP